MNAQHDQVSDAWRAHRAYLVDLAFRMLGDMAVQDLCRTDALRVAGTADGHQTPDTRAIGRAPPSWCHLPPTPIPPTRRSCAVHNHGIKSTAAGGELVELGDSICGLLADGYSMNAITTMGNLYAGSGMTPDDAKFVMQMSAAACPEYVQ